MITVQTCKTTDLRLKGVTVGRDYTGHAKLSSIEYQAMRPPSFYDFRKLIEACCEAASPTLNTLFQNNWGLSP
jgi:hypothetical protein